MADWHPASWQRLPSAQIVRYPSAVALAAVFQELRQLPPLVTSWEIERLKGQLAAAARGEAFVLHGGDCAEAFDDCRSAVLTNKIKILLQMSLVLGYGLGTRIIRIGRIAGQYAKPRSEDTETVDGVTLPSYRGDLVNDQRFTAAARQPDPSRLVRGYGYAATTLNFIRGLVEGGFADLRHPENWDLDFARGSPHAADYQRTVRALGASLRFMENLAGTRLAALDRAELFTSHEALHLLYEQAQTRRAARLPGYYDMTTHLPWLGLRTGDPGGAHVEFLRGVRNPLGIKVGPRTSAEQLTALLARLDPEREPGRVTLIHRLGADQVASALPRLVAAVRASDRQVLWVCDPMHGNTEQTPAGRKTRRFDRVLSELEQSFQVHGALGSRLGGVHFELTGDDVTECTGGARGLDDADLERAYQTRVDPRLNYEQSLEMAMRIVRAVRGEPAWDAQAAPS